jgi:hypothetical protein
MTQGSDNGLYLNGTSFSYSPGDTFVLKASMNPYSYFTLEEFHGTAASPIVLINEGGQSRIQRMETKNCTYMKITGTGSSDQYGFYFTLPNQTSPSPAIAIDGKSAFLEVDHVDINDHGYGFWVKQEGSCDVSLQYPNWWLDHISIHDCRLKNLLQEGIYAGSTAPNGERSVVCNGITTNPLPIRLSNITIYNNIIDHTGRGGIQLSDAQQGNNEVYGNTITNAGFEYVPSQGNGIILGGYTTAYVHDNSVDYTYSTGIFSLGAGLVRIENNKVDHSGQLAGMTANGSASIMVDTRLTVPVINTQFYIKNNILGSNSDGHVRIYNTFNTYSTNNLICNNNTTTGGAITIYANTGIVWGTCTGNQLPVANPGQNQTITLPSNSASLSGSGTDIDGSIVGYKWSEVFGPNNANIASPSTAQTTVNGLVQGTYTFKLTVTDNGGATATANVNVVVNAATSGTTTTPPPPSSSSIHIEAESYSSMYGILTEPTSDAGGGKDVGYQDNNDWMDYSANIASAGSYTVNLRVASLYGGGQFQIRNSSGSVLATVNVPSTGGYQTWQTISTTLTLPAGQQTLRIFTVNSGGGWNLNWFDILASGSTTTTTTPPSSSSIHIEAESYSSMYGILTEPTSDAGGGKDVGYQDNNDWMDYSANIASAGSYTVNLRVASLYGGGQFQIRNSSGSVLATVNVPSTGGYQTWQTISTTLTLPAGQQTLRIFTVNSGGGWNLNWFDILASGSTTTTTTPPSSSSIHIEAESYSSMYGILTEPTSDAGGGKDVGYQDNNDWMDYSANIASAGSYTVNLRVASLYGGGQFQIRNSSGSVLATVNVPSTGGYQTWQTISTTLTLPAGQQTLRIFTVNSGGGWNLNWFDILASVSGAITTASRDSAVLANDPASALQVFPNPVEDRFALKINNSFKGQIKVSIVNTAGQQLKQFILQKTSTGTLQSYLSVADLPKGDYILTVVLNQWKQSVKLIKN